MKQPAFNYRRSWAVRYRGCWFDSLLELRFVLSIEGAFRFLREPIVIWYDPQTLKTTNYHREGIKTYTPDLLIRHKQSGKAYLIELKPDGFNDQQKLHLYKSIAENYIQEHGYDWTYQLVTYRDIALTPEEEASYQALAAEKEAFQHMHTALQTDQQRHLSAPTHKRMVPILSEDGWDQRSYAHWVKRGYLSHKHT